MAKTYNRLEIDVNTKPYDIITAVQADTNSRYLDVSLYENGLPIDLTGHEVKIFMQKPENGGEIWNDGTITDAAAGRCLFPLTTEALAKMGHLQTQISVWRDNEEILSTQIFEIYVTKSLLTESTVEASNEYGTLVLLFQKLCEAYDLMTAMVENFGAAGETAAAVPAATFWQMLEALYLMTRDALKNASVSEVLTRIGQTADTGGSATAGTAMAKLNALIRETDDISKDIADSTERGGQIIVRTCDAGENITVNGKGRLHFAMLYGDFRKKSSRTIKVTVDDRIILYVGLTNEGDTYSVSSAALGFADIDMIKATSAVNSAGIIVPANTLLQLGSISRIEFSENLQEFSSNPNTRSSSYYNKFIVTEGSIPFERKIIVEQTDNSGEGASVLAYAGYTLCE